MWGLGNLWGTAPKTREILVGYCSMQPKNSESIPSNHLDFLNSGSWLGSCFPFPSVCLGCRGPWFSACDRSRDSSAAQHSAMSQRLKRTCLRLWWKDLLFFFFLERGCSENKILYFNRCIISSSILPPPIPPGPEKFLLIDGSCCCG